MGDALLRPAVMADVARLAQVSVQTVSRVVNGSPRLAPDTRERVQAAIERLNYSPNPNARSLAARRSGTIGVIATTLGLWGPGETHRSVLAAAESAGFATASISVHDTSLAAVSAATRKLAALSVEGLVVVAGHDDAVAAVRSLGPQPPVVLVEGDLTKAVRTVGIDQVAGARLATAHLAELGHLRIAHLSGPVDWAEARSREAGWRAELAARGLPLGVVLRGDWTARSGYEAGRLLPAEVTAVVCGNDQMALGLLRALDDRRLRVPADVSVTGFDDIPEAAFLRPPLTTVRQDFSAAGRRAVEALRSALSDGPEPAGELILPSLVVRSSTAAPPTTGDRAGRNGKASTQRRTR